jgi:hypothetical protein
MVNKAAIRPEILRQPKGFFMVPPLPEQSCVIESRANVYESGHEQCHPDRDMDGVPDG